MCYNSYYRKVGWEERDCFSISRSISSLTLLWGNPGHQSGNHSDPVMKQDRWAALSNTSIFHQIPLLLGRGVGTTIQKGPGPLFGADRKNFNHGNAAADTRTPPGKSWASAPAPPHIRCPELASGLCKNQATHDLWHFAPILQLWQDTKHPIILFTAEITQADGLGNADGKGEDKTWWHWVVWVLHSLMF